MGTLSRLFISAALIPVIANVLWAQEQNPIVLRPPTTTIITASATTSSDRVRITASSSVVQIHVDIYRIDGVRVWDSEIHGNVFDWHLQDGQGQRILPGDYACVVTVKNIAGRITQKIGNVSVSEADVEVKPAEASQLSAPQSQAIGPVEENSSWTVVSENENHTPTVIAHDGTDGQIIRGRGALSFRLGDFFSGRDQEQMRLTEAGDLGIGTADPKSKLDVAGTIRAERFIISRPIPDTAFKTNGTAQSSLIDSTLVSGIGTQNQLPKWTDNSGTLGDSNVTDLNGNIGIGVLNPGDLLDIAGPPNAVGRSGLHVRTTGSTGNTTLYFDNDRGNFAAYGGLLTGGSANAFSFFGVSRADRTFLIADGPNSLGLGVGTLVSQPLLFGTSNAERMRITSGGSVGIGTTAPAYPLTVNGSAGSNQNQGVLEIANSVTDTGLRLRNSSVDLRCGAACSGRTWTLFSSGVNSGIVSGNFSIYDATAGQPRLSISSVGNVGINNIFPLAKLDIQGGADGDGSNDPFAMAFSYRNGGFRNWIRTRHNSGGLLGNAFDFFVNSSSTASGSSAPGVGNQLVMSLDGGSVLANGAVVVDQAGANTGTVNPGLTFGINSGEGISSNRNNSNNQFGLDFYTGSIKRMSITNPSGNVGIGTSNPQFPLDVNGNLNASNLPISLTTSGNGNGNCVTANDNSLDEITVNAPAAGSFFITAFLTFEGSDDTVDFSLNDVTAGTKITTIRSSVLSPTPGLNSQIRWNTVPISWSLDVPAGARKIRTTFTSVNIGTASTCVNQHALTVVYLPKKQ